MGRGVRCVGFHPIDLHRLGDVLDLLLPHVLEIQLHLAFDMIDDGAGHTDATRLSQPFHASRNVDPVPVDVVALDDDVADVDAHAVDNSLVFWDISVAQGHGSLHIDSEGNGVHDAAKLHQGAIAHEFDHPPVVLSGLGLDQFSANCLERRERPNLVGSHQAAVTDNVGSEDGGQPALYALFAHGKSLGRIAEEIAV